MRHSTFTSASLGARTGRASRASVVSSAMTMAPWCANAIAALPDAAAQIEHALAAQVAEESKLLVGRAVVRGGVHRVIIARGPRTTVVASPIPQAEGM